MLLRKVRKLIVNPKLFFKDFVLKRTRQEQQTNPYSISPNNAKHHSTEADLFAEMVATGSFETRCSPFEMEDFLALFSLIPNFFIVKKWNGSISLCTTQTHRDDFLSELLGTSIKNSFVCMVKDDGIFNPITSLRQLLTIPRTSKIISMQFSDLRSLKSFSMNIEFWVEERDFILSPRANPISNKVWVREVQKHGLMEPGKISFLSEIINNKELHETTFDVDVVYTWVNSDDKDWQKMFSQFKPLETNDSNGKTRFRNRNELKFSLRSIHEFAPWVNKIFIVSNCKPPEWLNLDHPKIQWVYHEEIFNKTDLPTFSSHAIEACLHRIKGLSNYFIYMNDDFSLARPTQKNDFFLSNGLCKIKLEPFGNVNGDPNENEPDYLNGARNSQKLLIESFGKCPTQLHTHSPQAIRVDLLNEMEQRYSKEFSQTASNRFRSIDDVAVTGFLFHHYAYCSGNGVYDPTRTQLIQQNHAYKKIFSTLLKTRDKSNVISFCINDGGDSDKNNDWNESSIRFLEDYFPNSSPFERC